MDSNKVYKILIVDDDHFLTSMYERKFKAGNHEVITVASGDEALSKLKEGFSPDAVVLDVVMPEPDGLQTLEAIRKENLAKDAAMIMLTNQGASEEIERAKKSKIDGYIVKAAMVPSEVVGEIIKIVEEKKSR